MPEYVELRPKFREADEPETFFYEVMDDRSVRRRIVIVSGGGYRWDDVRAHTEPDTLLGVNSCIYKMFPSNDGRDDREVAYIYLDANRLRGQVAGGSC